MIFDDDLNIRNNIHCHYLLGLGYLGLEQYEKSGYHFREVLQLDPAHLGVMIHMAMPGGEVEPKKTFSGTAL
jgi:hypothetical protein